MRDVTTGATDEKSFPETLNFAETGQGYILLGKEVRTNIKTKYGERTVVECLERISKKKVSVWWPKDMPLPALTFPFMLVRLSKREWKLVTCDTREEALELWKTGEVKNPVASTNGDSDFS